MPIAITSIIWFLFAPSEILLDLPPLIYCIPYTAMVKWRFNHDLNISSICGVQTSFVESLTSSSVRRRQRKEENDNANETVHVVCVHPYFQQSEGSHPQFQFGHFSDDKKSYFVSPPSHSSPYNIPAWLAGQPPSSKFSSCATRKAFASLSF